MRAGPATLALSRFLDGEYSLELGEQDVDAIIEEICACSRPEEIIAGYRSRQRIEDLICLTQFGLQRFRDAARLALGEVLGDDLVPTLGQVIRGSDSDGLKRICVEILGEQGRDAEVLVPDLINTLVAARQDPALRIAILETLVRIGQPDDVILPLWVGLEDPEVGGRSSALSALISLGPDVGDAIHGIEAVARNPREDPAVRSAAIEFIEANGRCAEAILRRSIASHIGWPGARPATSPHLALGVAVG